MPIRFFFSRIYLFIVFYRFLIFLNNCFLNFFILKRKKYFKRDFFSLSGMFLRVGMLDRKQLEGLRAD